MMGTGEERTQEEEAEENDEEEGDEEHDQGDNDDEGEEMEDMGAARMEATANGAGADMGMGDGRKE